MDKAEQLELNELERLFALKKVMEEMTLDIAKEEKNADGRTRQELRDHLDFLDELDAQINVLKEKYKDQVIDE
jgi:transposase